MFSIISSNRHLVLSVSLLALGALSACAQSEGDAAKPTQIVAKVNNSELSVHQLNFSIQGVQEANPERLAKIRKAALDRLVEQEALMQDAIAKKLDRDPNVRSQLDAAQREILVRNHLQKLGVSVAVPTDDQIAKFYGDNPLLFKDRLIYQFTEIVVPRKPDNWQEIEKAIAPMKTIEEIVVEIRKKGLSLPISQNVIRGAEDLPTEALKEFAKFKDEEIVVYARSPAIVIAQIKARKLAPLDEVKAKPSIVRYLTTQSKNDLVQSQVRKIMDSAKIAYVGEFASDARPPLANKSGEPDTPKDARDPVEALNKGLKTLK